MTSNRSRLSRPRRALLGSALVAALCLGAGARAGVSAPGAAELAELPLDVLLDMPVAGASRLGVPRSEAAASVSVVGAAEIRALGWRTLAEVLDSMRGLSVSDDRTYSYLGVRGFSAPGDYNTRVLLLIDGHRANDVVYDQAYLGSEFPLDLELVERVEFIPGPSSPVYGANALFGVVNVVTRSAGTPGTRGAGLELGSDARRRVRLADSRRWDGGSLQWSASRLLSKGEDLVMPERASAFAPGGVVRGADGERRNAFYMRAVQGALSLSLVHSERHKGAPLVPDAVYGDNRASDRDEQTLLDLDWSRPLGEADRIALRASAGRYRFIGHYAFDHPPVVLNRDDAGARWGNVEARWTSTRWAGHRVGVGAEWQHIGGLYQRNTDLGPPDSVYLDDRRSANRGALFAEDQWEWGDGLALNLAGRWDHVKDQPAHLSPRLALLWHATPALVLKAVHGRSWRPPNAFETHYEVPGEGGYKRNPDLRSEGVSANELALEWRPGVHDRFSASLYHQRARRLLVLQRDEADGLLQFRNLGALDVRGFEAEYERVTTGGLRLRANLSLQQPHGGGDGGDAVARLAPRRMAKATLIVPLPRDWNAGFEAQAVSRRGPAAGHALAHLTLSTPLAQQGASLLLGVRNLFDRQVDDPGYDPVDTPTVPQRGRSVIARLEWSF